MRRLVEPAAMIPRRSVGLLCTGCETKGGQSAEYGGDDDTADPKHCPKGMRCVLLDWSVI